MVAKKGAKVGTILTPDQIKEIRSKYKDGLTIVDLSKMYFVSGSTIHRTLAGGSNPIKMRPAGPLGSLDVSTDQIIELKEVQGLSYQKIAAKVSLSPATVQERYKRAKGMQMPESVRTRTRKLR